MKISNILLLLLVCSLLSCKKYLDVIPDNIATIQSAFSSRTTTEKYLFTCYSYLPSHGSSGGNTFMITDEMWLPYPQESMFYFNQVFDDMALNNQNKVNPAYNFWDGLSGGKPMFRAIRDCNIFLENIAAVPGMQDMEKKRWIAEVKFLKAYYHFWLIRMYGPIPLIKTNLPVSAGVNDVKVTRDPVDDCFSYVVELLDEAIQDLPQTIENQSSEQGRINKMIAMSVKAEVLVTAASPLFNGNPDYATFKDNEGRDLFNGTFSDEKWKKAVEACKTAIETTQAAGLTLYEYMPLVNTYALSPATMTQMSIRNSVTEKWNSEIIWANTNSLATELQGLSQGNIDPSRTANFGVYSMFAPTLKIAEMYYSKNGVPIEEDLTYDYNGRYTVKTATQDDRFNIVPGYRTASLHFDRENRFYASLGFDGGVWYGQGRYDDKNTWSLQAKGKQAGGKRSISRYSITGYLPKKLVNFQNIIEAGDGGPYTIKAYPFPIIRLADLYLLYTEALNESEGPTTEAYKWINLVRKRAGLKSVEESWTNYSRLSAKFKNKEDFRKIIQQERMIELAFEGHRYWDVMRWKKARELFNTSIQGWDIEQEATEYYYRVKTLFNKKFSSRDYFWPIRENSMIINNKLVQNPGW